MTMNQLWEYLASTSKHVSIKPRLVTKHGDYLCGNHKGCYYVTKGNVTIRVNPYSYACFLQVLPTAGKEVPVTKKSKYFTFYGGFELTSVGKRFLIIEEGANLKLKYMKEMDDAINKGLVSTYIKPFWYYPFLSTKYYVGSSSGRGPKYNGHGILTPEETKAKVEGILRMMEARWNHS